MYLELDQDNLGQLLGSHEKVMVQFGASWCGNCKITKPKFRMLAEENEGVVFVYADAEKFPGSRQFADVNNLPTFAGFVNGRLSLQKQGNKLETIREVFDAVVSH